MTTPTLFLEMKMSGKKNNFGTLINAYGLKGKKTDGNQTRDDSTDIVCVLVENNPSILFVLPRYCIILN